ncbi:MAG: hypothetical protein CL928_10410 [Deltaproteobacteria bacterium]|nr:hypothetical protein [Deltaproteobacteria bacterium]
MVLTLALRVLQDFFLVLMMVGPGLLVARWFRPRPTPLQWLSEGLLCSLTVVSVPVFSLALLTRQYLDWRWMLAGSLAVAVPTVLALLRRHQRNWRDALLATAPASPWSRSVVVVALAVFVLFLVNYDRSHFHYACINGVVMQAITEEAAPPFDPHGADQPFDPNDQQDPGHLQVGGPEARAPGARMDLIDSPGTGQRYGTTALIAPVVALFDAFGFRLVYALMPCLAFLFGFRLLRSLLRRSGLALLASVLCVVNPYVLKIVILDENVLAFATATAALALLVEGRLPLLAGVALGATLGIRHVDLPLLVTAGILLGGRRKDCLLALLGTVLAACPSLLHHQATYGTLFAHEHFVDEVFLAVPHRFLGWEFRYTGLLNVPFVEQWIRTPYNPFPTSLYYPINTVAHLGSLVAAVGLIGVVLLWVRERRLALALLCWVAPVYGLLAVLENWMDPNKMGLILILFPVLLLGLGYGLDWLANGSARRLGVLLGTAAALSMAMVGVGELHIEDDPRFYAKYPHVRPERPEYYDFERSVVTTGSPLPSAYFLQQYSDLRPMQRLASAAGDYLDRRFRRDGEVQVLGGDRRAVDWTLDLSRPLVGRTDFARLEAGGAGLDMQAEGAAHWLVGMETWEEQPAELRVVRKGPSEVALYLRFGKEGFAEVESEAHFSIEETRRPDLQPRRVPSDSLTLRVRAGDRVQLYETVSMDEVLVYTWEFVVDDSGIEVGPARRMFHN